MLESPGEPNADPIAGEESLGGYAESFKPSAPMFIIFKQSPILASVK